MRDQSGISFDNTVIGFRHLSDSEVRKRKHLFIMFHLGLIQFNIKLWTYLHTTRILRPLLDYIGLLLAKLFHGGTNLQACETITQQLYNQSIFSTLDYCMEHSNDFNQSQCVLDELKQSLEYGVSHQAVAFIVMKVTSLIPTRVIARLQSHGRESLSTSETQHLNQILRQIEDFLSQLADTSMALLVDAEESWVQNEIDHWVEGWMRRFNQGEQPKIYHTVQMYRRDRLDYLTALINQAQQQQYKLGIKIVRGAYMEKEQARARQQGYQSPIHQSKSATDHDFNQALDLCLNYTHVVNLYIASHNEQSLQHAFVTMMQHTNSTPSSATAPWFAQLLGIGDHLSYHLAHRGCKVSKYIPYGPVHLMMPYLIRRAEENTAMDGHGKREYALLKQEWHRRRAKA